MIDPLIVAPLFAALLWAAVQFNRTERRRTRRTTAGPSIPAVGHDHNRTPAGCPAAPVASGAVADPH